MTRRDAAQQREAPSFVTAGPLERRWVAFRESAMPRACSPGALRASRLAFYSAASAVLAELAASNGSIDTLAAMSDELDDFLFEMATEAMASRPSAAAAP